MVVVVADLTPKILNFVMARTCSFYNLLCLVLTSFPAKIFKLCNWQCSLSTCWPVGKKRGRR